MGTVYGRTDAHSIHVRKTSFSQIFRVALHKLSYTHLSMLKKFFSKSKPAVAKIREHSEKLAKDFDKAYRLAKKQQEELVASKTEVEEHNALLQEKEQVLQAFGEAAGGLLNIKDREGKFLWMNKYTCTEFFGLPETCMDSVKGLTDIDLLNAYRERTGKPHTFGDICVSTDEHARKEGKRCMYIEFGQRGDTPIVLKMIKTPADNGNLVCFGWDVTYCCNDIRPELEQGILEGTVEKLSDVVYWVRDPHRCLGHIPKTFIS